MRPTFSNPGNTNFPPSQHTEQGAVGGKERGLHKDQGCLAHALDLTGELDPTPGLFPFILFSGLSPVWATLVCYRSVPKAYSCRLWFIFHLSHTVNHKLISSFKRKRWRLQVCSFAELGGSSEMK